MKESISLINKEDEKKKNSKSWKYIESLAKSTILALFISLGVNNSLNAQTRDKEQNKEIKKELVTRVHTINLKIYKGLLERYKKNITLESQIHFKNTVIDEEIGFDIGFDNYKKSYLQKKERDEDIIYADNDGDGSVDRIIVSEERFKTKTEKSLMFTNLAFLDKEFFEIKLNLSEFGKMMSKKIKIVEFKDIDRVPRFVIYDFNDGIYGETDKGEIYDLWLKYQENYVKSLENFYKEFVPFLKSK